MPYNSSENDAESEVWGKTLIFFIKFWFLKKKSSFMRAKTNAIENLIENNMIH